MLTFPGVLKLLPQNKLSQLTLFVRIPNVKREAELVTRVSRGIYEQLIFCQSLLRDSAPKSRTIYEKESESW